MTPEQAVQSLFYTHATFWLAVVGVTLLVVTFLAVAGVRADMARHIATCAQYLGLSRGFQQVAERRKEDTAQAVARIEQKVDAGVQAVHETKRAAEVLVKTATDSAMFGKTPPPDLMPAPKPPPGAVGT